MAPLALISVSNKAGLVPLAKALTETFGYELISSGGTAKKLEKEGIQVQRVANYTGAEEILGGRVKTLHPKIHGGILAKRDNNDHINELEKNNINLIDLVIVNLYPFEEVISNPNASSEIALENIDIGGPTMVRAAAKNHKDVTILTKPEQYPPFIEALAKGQGCISGELKLKFALEAFEHTASYDIAISQWMKTRQSSKNNQWIESIPLKQTLRYGENPHQKATWFSKPKQGWGGAVQLQGKELSTNNLLDLEAAFLTVKEFGYEYTEDQKAAFVKPATVVIKHTNPCGVAISESIEDAVKKALDADRTSAFGGIVALNQSVNLNVAEELKTLFLECIVAPSFDKEALKSLSSKPNLRLIELKDQNIEFGEKKHIRSILGGLLIQELDDYPNEISEWKVVSAQSPNNDEEKDIEFAWNVVKHVRSNAIVIAKDGKTLGIGAGQMNRIGSAQIALESARENCKGSVLASDGFFPFDDTVRLAAKFGVQAIIQPGGSIRDQDSIEACNEMNMSMIFTGKRHFLH
tara:strand:+ start:1091 stop:2659 length:1569 start_codon:yes stop_codon:yes gene_type:complete